MTLIYLSLFQVEIHKTDIEVKSLITIQLQCNKCFLTTQFKLFL